MGSSLSRKYHDRVEARKAQRKMEADYLKLQKLEDDVIDYGKLSPSKEREPLRKQNSSPPVVPKEEIIGITL